MPCQDDDQCVSFNCNTTSSGSQCKCVVNALGSSLCDFKFLKDDCNNIGCFWDEKELVETAKCKTRQSKCALTIYATQIQIVFLAPNAATKTSASLNATC